MFNIKSTDGFSYIEMKLLEKENNYLPSLCIALEIQNQGFTARISNVWIEWDNIIEFIKNSKETAYNSNFLYTLESMSPDEMRLELKQISAEICLLSYLVSKISSGIDPIQLKGSFEVGMEKLCEIRTAFMEVGKVVD